MSQLSNEQGPIDSRKGNNEGVPRRSRRDRNAKPYGAYELKARYQQGMLFGTLTTALIAVIFSSLIVYSTPVEQAPTHVDSRDTVVVDIKRVKWYERDRPQIDQRQMKNLMDKIGIPKPIPDDELLNTEFTIASKRDLKYLNDVRTPFIEDTIGKEFLFMPVIDDPYPKHDEFVFFETPPEMIYMAKPVYPNIAKIAGLEGKVWVKALVDMNGDVVEVIILKSSGSKAGFDEAAVRSAKKCKFRPAVQNGFNVAVWVSFAVEFKLRD